MPSHWKAAKGTLHAVHKLTSRNSGPTIPEDSAQYQDYGNDQVDGQGKPRGGATQESNPPDGHISPPQNTVLGRCECCVYCVDCDPDPRSSDSRPCRNYPGVYMTFVASHSCPARYQQQYPPQSPPRQSLPPHQYSWPPQQQWPQPVLHPQQQLLPLPSPYPSYQSPTNGGPYSTSRGGPSFTYPAPQAPHPANYSNYRYDPPQQLDYGPQPHYGSDYVQEPELMPSPQVLTRAQTMPVGRSCLYCENGVCSRHAR